MKKPRAIADEPALLRRVRRETAEAVLCHLVRVYEESDTDCDTWGLLQAVRTCAADVPGLLRRLGLEDPARASA